MNEAILRGARILRQIRRTCCMDRHCIGDQALLKIEELLHRPVAFVVLVGWPPKR